MAIIRGHIAASIDGFIADREGAIDWLKPFEHLDFRYGDFIAGVSVAVMGRRTYEQIIGFGGAWPYHRQTTLVVTGRALRSPPPNVEAWHAGIPALAGHLRALRGGDVWIVGGAMLQTELIDLGALDRLEIYIMPVLLGRGLPLFRRLISPRAAKLRMAETLAGGIVRLDYRLGASGGRSEEFP